MGTLASFPLYGVYVDAITNHPYLVTVVALALLEAVSVALWSFAVRLR